MKVNNSYNEMKGSRKIKKQGDEQSIAVRFRKITFKLLLSSHFELLPLFIFVGSFFPELNES